MQRRSVFFTALVLVFTGLVACGGETSDAPIEDTASESADSTSEDTSEASDADASDPDVAVDSSAAPDTVATDTEPAPQPLLFGRSDLPVLTIDLDPVAKTLLVQDPSDTIAAEVTVAGVAVVGARLTFTETDDVSFGGKPDFRLLLQDVSDAEPTVSGIHSLHLDGMSGDSSQLDAQLAYYLMNRLGVIGPRATYVRLLIDGEDYGLYSVIEATESPALRDRLGAGDGILAAARRRVDLWTFQVDDLTIVHGDPDAALDQLTTLAQSIDTLEDAVDAVSEGGDPVDVVAELGQLFDLDAYLRLAAADVFIARRINYQFRARDYALYRDEGQPWRFLADQVRGVFVDYPDHWGGSGRMHRLCLADLDCRARFAAALDGVLADVESEGLVAEAFAFAATVRSWLINDSRLSFSLDEVDLAMAQRLAALRDRSAWLDENSACADPPSVDGDEDGYSGCTDDCDDDDDAVHPGAEELCDLRDNDCDGVLDDSENCPDCVEREVAGRRIALCYQRLNWEDARARCQELGGDLVSLETSELAAEVRLAAVTVQWTSWWIGFNDQAEEGVFAWSDGTPADFANWGDSEPNDSGGEDCAHLRSDGFWNDLSCDRFLNFVCGLPDEQ